MTTWRFGRTARAALVCAAAGLAGCQASYVATLRNNSPQPIIAELVKAEPGGAGTALSRERIAPGDIGAVQRYNVPAEWQVYLQVDAAGNPRGPVRAGLGRGQTTFNITQVGNTPGGELRLELVSWN